LGVHTTDGCKRGGTSGSRTILELEPDGASPLEREGGSTCRNNGRLGAAGDTGGASERCVPRRKESRLAQTVAPATTRAGSRVYLRDAATERSGVSAGELGFPHTPPTAAVVDEDGLPLQDLVRNTKVAVAGARKRFDPR
jgi:hypothetical protein